MEHSLKMRNRVVVKDKLVANSKTGSIKKAWQLELLLASRIAKEINK